jgi:hypothetical protein
LRKCIKTKKELVCGTLSVASFRSSPPLRNPGLKAPPDVLHKIISNLRDDICPIYSESDVQEDIVNISLGFGVVLNDYKLKDELDKTYTYDYAYRMTKISRKEFEGLKIKGKRQAQGIDVRRFMREKYKGEIIEWIKDQCKPIEIDEWIIKSMQPFRSDEPIPIVELQNVNGIIKTNDIKESQEVREYLKAHKEEIEKQEYKDELIDKYASNEKRKMACKGRLQEYIMKASEIHRMIEEIDENRFKPGVLRKVQRICETYNISWISRMHNAKIIELIFSNTTKIEPYLGSNVREIVEDFTRYMNLDEEAANLIRFQQTYAAAAKIISTSQTIFDTLLAAAR